MKNIIKSKIFFIASVFVLLLPSLAFSQRDGSPDGAAREETGSATAETAAREAEPNESRDTAREAGPSRTESSIAADDFANLKIDEPEETPSAWSIFWTKAAQNLSLLAAINPIEDASKRIKYAEESLWLAKFAVDESTDAEHLNAAFSLLRRSEELMTSLYERKDNFTRAIESASLDLSRNIIVHLMHRQNVIVKIENKVGSGVLQKNGINRVEFQSVLDSLRKTAEEYRDEIFIASGRSAPKARGSGNFKNDQDRDGILDEVEKEIGLSIIDFDTDGDGLNDRKEVETYGTDPTKTDTDGDGYWDGMEIISGYNPLGAGKMDSKAVEQRITSSNKFINRVKTGRQLSPKAQEYFKKVGDIYLKQK